MKWEFSEMKVLFVYRNSKMGFSIGKLFHYIENAMRQLADVDHLELPCANYHPVSLMRNVRCLKRKLRSQHYDVVHITGTEHYLLPFLRKEKIVVTVHDLGFYTQTKRTLRTRLKFLLWIKTLPLASYVAFISDKSKEEAMGLVTFRKGCYGTVWNPIDPAYKSFPKHINTSCPVILHVGTKENKNLKNTILALDGGSCRLRIVGQLSEKQIEMLRKHAIDYSSTSNLTDAEMLQEYINCDYVNFPSLYEGFGMPILEGQAVGRPVLTSNLRPMVDVAGEGAVLVDPASPESIRKGYEYISSHVSLLVQSGIENAKRFHVSRVARQYYDIYTSLLIY